MSFEIKINYTDESRDTVLFFQESNNQIFTHIIPSGLTIKSIEFDPSHWLLAQHTVKKGTVSIQEKGITQKFSLYPNPTNDFINIQFEESLNGKKDIELLNMEGREIKKAYTNATHFQLNTSALSPGIYQLLIHCNGETGFQKLIKQ